MEPQRDEKNCPCCAGLTDPGRRSALAVILAGAGTLVLAPLGLAGGFLSNSLGRKADRPWIKLGRVDDFDVLNVETFQRHILQVEHEHGWIRKRAPLDIYIKDLYPKPPLAFQSTCSHLGCSVKWEAGDKQFKCPCHGGLYNEQGEVVSGPPPRPLTQLEVKIEDEQCFVRLPGPDSEAGGSQEAGGAGAAAGDGGVTA